MLVWQYSNQINIMQFPCVKVFLAPSLSFLYFPLLSPLVLFSSLVKIQFVINKIISLKFAFAKQTSRMERCLISQGSASISLLFNLPNQLTKFHDFTLIFIVQQNEHIKEGEKVSGISLMIGDDTKMANLVLGLSQSSVMFGFQVLQSLLQMG